MKMESLFAAQSTTRSMAEEIALIDELRGDKIARRQRYERKAAYFRANRA